MLQTIGDELPSESASLYAITGTLYASAMLLLQTLFLHSHAPPMSVFLPSHAVADIRPTDHISMAFPCHGLVDDQLRFVQPFL